MNIEINSMDMVQILPILFGVLIGIMLIALAFNQYVHKLDDNKELITKKVKILQTTMRQGNIEWYIVECENGERIKLRNLQADKVIIDEGDSGLISYKGQTIQSFKRS